MAAALTGAAVILAPNLVWNALNGFATVAHTADNAQWCRGERFNPGEVLQFLGEQLGVFGIVPFLTLCFAATLLLARPGRLRALPAADAALLCLTLPPLLIVAVQAFISRANANWAVAAYAPGAVMVAAWLVRRASARWAQAALGATVVSQGAVAAVFLLVVISPTAVSALGLDNAFKRARGWRETTAAVVARAQNGAWTAVAVDDRLLFNAAAYYGRNFWSRPEAPPLRMWVRETEPQNQAETEAPLRPSEAGRILHASLTPAYARETARDFWSWRPLGVVSVRLDEERAREIALFEASGWRRAPRDPLTGRPYAIPTAP